MQRRKALVLINYGQMKEMKKHLQVVPPSFTISLARSVIFSYDNYQVILFLFSYRFIEESHKEHEEREREELVARVS